MNEAFTRLIEMSRQGLTEQAAQDYVSLMRGNVSIKDARQTMRGILHVYSGKLKERKKDNAGKIPQRTDPTRPS